MNRLRYALDGLLLLGIGALTMTAFAQHSELQEMQNTVAMLEARPSVSPPQAMIHADPRDTPVKRRGAQKGGGAHPETTDVPSLEERMDRRQHKQQQRAERPGFSDENLAELIDSEDSMVRSRLRKVIEEERSIMRQERQEKRRVRWEGRMKDRVEKFADKAGLDATQTARVEDVLLAERLETWELFRQARQQEMSFPDAHEKASELQAKTNEEVKTFIAGDQMEAFAEVRTDLSSHRPRRNANEAKKTKKTKK